LFGTKPQEILRCALDDVEALLALNNRTLNRTLKVNFL
jgi:hypothetical protein